MADTLLLNADFRPLSLYPLSAVTWRDAVRLVITDRVSVVEVYDDWVVHSQRVDVQVPSVIATKVFVPAKEAKVFFSREAVLHRDRHTCQYCGVVFPPKKLTLDHVIPASRGGATSWTNIVAACGPCNAKKADKMLMKPISEPKAPDYWDLAQLLSEASPDETNNFWRNPTWRKYSELS